MNTDLVLIRGLPGAGKTTLAKKIAERLSYKHFEADQYFETDEGYKFNPTFLPDAHAWCFKMAKEALQAGHKVVIANTFTTHWEMEPYYRYAMKNGHSFGTVSLRTQYESIHNIPPETFQKMQDRWEMCPGWELEY